MSGPQSPSKLATTSRLTDPDTVFRALVEAHRGLDEAKSADLNARLVLILANEVGQDALVLAAIAAAAQPLVPTADQSVAQAKICSGN